MSEGHTRPAAVDTRILGGLIVTMDAQAREIANGCIEIRDGRISHVGAAPSADPASQTIDAAGMIVIPGLINTHCHTSQQLARGLADDVDLLTWLHDRIWPYEAALTEQEAELSALACALEQIHNGVTTIADPGGQHVDGMARAIEAAGIRAYVGQSSMDEGAGLPARMVMPTAEVLRLQDDLAQRWHGAADGRVRFSYTLRTIFNCSDDLIGASIDRARARGTIVQMHVAEVPAENEHTRATRGATTVRHLARIQALGPWLLAAHAVWIDDEEMGLLAATGTPVSHNLASNLRVLGLPRVADMLDRGILVGIGTDGAPANNRMSLIDEMYAASLLQKGLRLDPKVLPAREVLRMATVQGARALAWEAEVGSLEAGKAGDLVLIDPRTANMIPVHDPVSSLVTAMKTENVRAVMCGGRWLLREGAITFCDEAAVLSEAQRRAEEIAHRAGIALNG